MHKIQNIVDRKYLNGNNFVLKNLHYYIQSRCTLRELNEDVVLTINGHVMLKSYTLYERRILCETKQLMI